MNWLFIGTLAGSLVTSSHDNKEACEGRAFTLREKGVIGKCVDNNLFVYGTGTGTLQLCTPNGLCSVK